MNETNPDKYIFSWYNSTAWANDTATSYTDGQEIQVNKTITANTGDINWTWYFNDTVGNNNQTDVWGVTLTDTVEPGISFVDPTPANATTQSATNVEINVSITETNLDEVKYNWNGTNYTVYNDSLVLMYNFDNVSVLGENSTYVVDNSNYGNNGTVTSATMNLTGGKYGGAFEFDGISDYITVDSMNGNINGTITISTWINWKGDSADTDPTGRLTLINLLSPEDDVWLNLNADGNSKFNVYFGDLASPGYHDSTSSITKDEWHYLVANWNGSHVNLYIDGILDKSVSTTGDVDVGSSSFKIGSRENFADGWNFFFNGSIDEVRIWNRSLSTDEIYQQYASNLNKFNSTQWYLYVNQSKNATTGLADGDYTYYASAKDSAGNENSTEERKVTIDSTYPSIEFTGGTESNNTYFNRDWVFANVSITELNMRNISWNWNGTEYVLYDESSILLFNFDNVSALGDNASYATDISKYNNSGIISGAAWNTSGRFHSALSFDGVNDFVNITNDTIFSVMPFSMGFWFNPVQDYNLSSNPASFVSHNDYDIFIGDGNLTFRFLGYNLSSSKTSWNKNEWYNVQMVRNKEKQSIYINGSLNASTVFSNLEIQNSNGDTTALFDNYGNIILRGSCVIGGCDYPLDDAFVVQNDSDTVAYVNSSGHLCIEDDDCGDMDADCSGPDNGSLVITNDVEPQALVVGNPFTKIGWVDKKVEKLNFDQNDISLCGNFELIDGKLFSIK